MNPDPAVFERRHVSALSFAGRIGGNQVFTASKDNEKGRETLDRQPDAAPLSSLVDAFSPAGFLTYENYRVAIIDGSATCLLVFAGGAGASGLTTLQVSPLAISLYASLLNGISLSLFVYAAAPVSGGHLNPCITMATFVAGLSTLPRSIIYITAQCVGAIIGSYWLKLGLGDEFFRAGTIPGCTVDPLRVSQGQYFVMEYMFALALIFLAFGVGLDPRQSKVFGPALSPVLIGLTLSFVTLAASIARPGLAGVSLNPARCLGLMIAKGDMQYHHVHWLGPMAASIMNGLFYHFAPPYEKQKSETPDSNIDFT